MNICIDCGDEYLYDPKNPLGASTIRCSSCRKKDSKFNKKARLFEIAGDRCLKCGYSNSIYALHLFNAIDPLHTPKTQEELEQQAHKQFPLCLNCKAEIESKDVEMKVVSRQPIRVEFYQTRIEVIKTKLEDFNKIESNVEIVDEEPKEFRQVSTAPKKIT